MDQTSLPQHRLVFLTVNSSYSHSSLALPLLHCACRELSNWEWIRYDMTNDSNIIEAVRYIYNQHCDLLVTDLYLFNRQTALDVLQRYHALKPDCRIAVGGPECLGDGAEELLKLYPWLDCVFRGEGEHIFYEYLLHFDDQTIPGHSILPAEGNAVYDNWAESPCPATDPFFVTDKPFVQIETSRGCPMNCFYCTSGKSPTRYRSLEQVRQELKLLSRRGVKELRLLDRTFNLPCNRGAALLKMFREEFSSMRFHLELHPQFLDEGLKQELLRAHPGQLHIEAGIQCLDAQVQQLSGRCSQVDAALTGLKFLCDIPAFETHADLLAGLPGQRWQHILHDTAALMSVHTAEIQLEVLKVLPGTPMRQIASEHALCFSPTAPWDVMQTATMTMEDIQQARNLSRLLDMTYNHKSLHQAVWFASQECPDFVVKLLDFFHCANGDSMAVWDLKKRFLFMLDFCKHYHLECSQKALAYQWLLAGFLPSQGPDEYSEKVSAIPPEARLLSGFPESRTARESRFWRFDGNDGICYLAYNRSFSLNRPAAIWLQD